MISIPNVGFALMSLRPHEDALARVEMRISRFWYAKKTR
jgi:hypothetical protein